MPRSQLVACAIALCAIAWLGARYLSRGDAAAPVPVAASAHGAEGSDALEVEPSGGGLATVHVAGEVRRPGVYRLRASSRVEQAVDSAGGATRRADLDGLNLAQKVQDGRQILVPRRGVAAAAASVPGAASGAGGAPVTPVDLNRATLQELDTLDGVGPATAQKILDYREQHGGFGSVEELGQVTGIGEKRMAALRERVRV